jgi:hypothetical protein
VKVPFLPARPRPAPARPPDPATAGHDRLKAWVLHLRDLALDLAAAPGLDPAQAAHLRTYAEDLDSTLGAHPLNFDLRLYLARGEEDTLRPALLAGRLLPQPDQALLAALAAVAAALPGERP